MDQQGQIIDIDISEVEKTALMENT